jgi:Uma2 family endonuclease
MNTQGAIHETVHTAVVPSLPDEEFGVPPGLPLERIYRFTVEEYRQLGERGILREDEGVELIEGIVVAMSPKSVAHRYAVDALLTILPAMLASDWYPSGQNPLQLTGSEPEPDVTLLRGSYRDYRDRHPQPQDAGLVIEVAESSLDYDRRTKGFLYSKHEVPEYWIVNLVDACVEVYRSAPDKPQHFLPAESYGVGSDVPLVIASRRYGSVRVADLITGAERT